MMVSIISIFLLISLKTSGCDILLNKCCPDGEIVDLHTKECVRVSPLIERTFQKLTVDIANHNRSVDLPSFNTLPASEIIQAEINITSSSSTFFNCSMSQRRNVKQFILFVGDTIQMSSHKGETFNTFCVDRYYVNHGDKVIAQVCDECAGKICLSFCCEDGSFTSGDQCKKGDTSPWNKEIQRLPHKRIHSDLYCDNPIKYTKDLYKIEDGQLVIDNIIRDHSEYCIQNVLKEEVAVSNVLLCPRMKNKSEHTRITFKIVLIILSEVSIFIVLFFRILISGLRRSHFAKIKISFLSCLFITFFLIILNLFVDYSDLNEDTCIFIGLLLQYFWLATFLFQTCMSFEIWRIFRKLNDPTDNIQEQQRIRTILNRIYFLLSFVVPLFIMLVTAILQKVGTPGNDFYLHPGIGLSSCFLDLGDPAFYYFYLIILISLCINLVFYVLTIYAFFWGVWANNRNFNIKRDNMKMSLELIPIMGLNWFAEIVSFMINWQVPSYWLNQYIIWICDIFTWPTGIFIFISFVMRSSNRRLLKDYFGCGTSADLILKVDNKCTINITKSSDVLTELKEVKRPNTRLHELQEIQQTNIVKIMTEEESNHRYALPDAKLDILREEQDIHQYNNRIKSLIPQRTQNQQLSDNNTDGIELKTHCAQIHNIKRYKEKNKEKIFSISNTPKKTNEIVFENDSVVGRSANVYQEHLYEEFPQLVGETVGGQMKGGKIINNQIEEGKKELWDVPIHVNLFNDEGISNTYKPNPAIKHADIITNINQSSLHNSHQNDTKVDEMMDPLEVNQITDEGISHIENSFHNKMKSSDTSDSSNNNQTWSQSVKKVVKESAKSDKIIKSIMELNDIEDELNKTVTAFNFLKQNCSPSSVIDDLEMSIKNGHDAFQSELCGSYIASIYKEKDQELSQQMRDIFSRNWKFLVKRLLPTYSREIIKAILVIYSSNPRDAEYEAYRQIKRFCKMEVVTVKEFKELIYQISNNQPIFDLYHRPADLNKSFYGIYDVILKEELPQNKMLKYAAMDHIETQINSIKHDPILQEWLLKKYRMDLKKYDDVSRNLDNLDWNSVDIFVNNIFFGSETHCIIKVRINNSPNIQNAQDLNNLIKIAIENIGAFVRTKKVTVEKPSTWGGGEIVLKLKWGGFMDGLFKKRQRDEDAVLNILAGIIRSIPKRMEDENYKEKLRSDLILTHNMLPISADDLIQQFEQMPLCKMDITEMDVELSYGLVNKTRKIYSNVPLWPYMDRKFNDIDAHDVKTGFGSQCDMKGLPASLKNEFIYNLELFRNDEDLYLEIKREVRDVEEPYYDIFEKYKNNGGTFAGWIKALECCRDNPEHKGKLAFKDEQSRIETINSIIDGIMEIYNLWYKRWEESISDLPKFITNYGEFEDYFKLHGLAAFHKMKKSYFLDKLEVCDQIWIWRERFGGYAHVCLYTGRFADRGRFARHQHHSVIHVHRNSPFALLKGTAVIQEDNLDDVIKENDECFIVRKENLTDEERNLMRDRARACVNPAKEKIMFSYNGFSGNCETCINAFYGVWEDERTSLQGMKVGNTNQYKRQKLIGLILALKKGSDEELRRKIRQRFDEESLPIYDN